MLGGQNIKTLHSLWTKLPQTFTQHDTKFLLSDPPLGLTICAQCPPLRRWIVCTDPNPYQQPTVNQKRGREEFVFCPPFLFWRSFSLYRITHYTTMFFLIQHASFQKNNIIKTLIFLTPSFSILFSRFFGRFLCFFWTTSISFPFECVFLFPSLIRLFILYQIQYRTTP